MVHQFKNNGYNMVLDVCSGSVHVVDDLVYDIIEIFQGRAKEEVVSAIASNGREYSFDESSSLSREEQIADAYEAVKSLADSGQLFTEDGYKNLIIDFKKRQTVAGTARAGRSS